MTKKTEKVYIEILQCLNPPNFEDFMEVLVKGIVNTYEPSLDNRKKMMDTLYNGFGPCYSKWLFPDV